MAKRISCAWRALAISVAKDEVLPCGAQSLAPTSTGPNEGKIGAHCMLRRAKRSLCTLSVLASSNWSQKTHARQMRTPRNSRKLTSDQPEAFVDQHGRSAAEGRRVTGKFCTILLEYIDAANVEEAFSNAP